MRFPSNKKVRVTPIRRSGGWLKAGHDGDFQYTGAVTKYCVKVDEATGKMPDPLADLSLEDKEALAKAVSVKPEDFNPYKKIDNYWGSYEVKLDKHIRVLDLNNPFDFIDYCVLLTNKNLIAPSSMERLNKGTYRFALIDEEEEVVEKKKSSDKKKEAYKHLGKLEQSVTKMKNFLKVYGKNAPNNATNDWLQTQLDEIIEENIDGFLTIMNDPNYEEKLEVTNALDAKAIIKSGRDEYTLPGGQVLGTLEETINFLKSPKNSDTLLTIRARIEAKK